jgi:hypothetical protein
MANIVYCHPSRTRHQYHVFTDLDFWDARKILLDLATVRRNYSQEPPGDEFPTQVVGDDLPPETVRKIEKRLKRAIPSPPRHLIVRAMVFDECFEFDPRDYFPNHWDHRRMLHFAYHRLPHQQSVLNNPYQEAVIFWSGDRIRVERRQRAERHDPPVRTERDARRRLQVPSCF